MPITAKSFQVLERSSKTLIFYRRIDVDDLEASIAYFNETDDSLTNIRTEIIYQQRVPCRCSVFDGFRS